MAFRHFLLGSLSHNVMVTALGSCVKWPLPYLPLSTWRHHRMGGAYLALTAQNELGVGSYDPGELAVSYR